MITITNKNIYRSEFSFSWLSNLDNVSIVDINDIMYYMSDTVELGESVTFQRLFDIIEANVSKFQEIFHSSLGGYPLEPFLQEIQNNPTKSIESEYLEIRWYCESYEKEFNMYSSFHGISTKEDVSYALDFTSLNDLKNLVVKLNGKVELFEFKNKGKYTYLGEKSFTLFDLYKSILSEITFHGGPLDKQDRLSELEATIDEYEFDKLTNDSEDKYTSLEDMIKKFEDDDEYLVKYRKKRDHVDSKRIGDKNNLIKLKNCLKEKLKIYDIIEKSKDDDQLSQYYKKLTDIEYNMQILYGEEENISYHKFWETPKCTCSKIDNLENYPSENPIFDDKCPIHGKK